MEGDCRWLQSNVLAFALKNNQLAKKQAVVGASDARLGFGVSGSGVLNPRRYKHAQCLEDDDN